MNTVANFTGGKVSLHVANWSKITSDSWVKRTLAGDIIDFLELPFSSPGPYMIGFSKTEKLAMDKAVTRFHTQNIIEQCPSVGPDSFFSAIFPRQKRDGSVRVIINLKGLNEHIDNHHFKMDTIRDVLLLVQPQCYFASIDFKDAYYSVPIASDSRKFLRFLWNATLYQFTCMPQGLASAPRIFTKLLKPALAHLRALGHTILCYIDDCILIAKDKEHLMDGVRSALQLFDSLGLTINLAKSVLLPTRSIEYLGVVINSVDMTVTLTPRKQNKIAGLADALLKKSVVTIQELAAFLGNLVAADVAIVNGPLHYKDLEIVRNNALSTNYGNYNASITLTEQSRQTITWWYKHIYHQQRPILIPEPECHLYTDASLTGWGGKLGNVTTGGHWADTEQDHINVLELKAAFLALQSLCRTNLQQHIRLHMDNTTAVACINKCGSTKLSLLAIVTKIFTWADQHDITLSACHIPGRLNVDADRASRTLNVDTEWMLSPQVFNRLCHQFRTPDIDLFATVLNAQLPIFASWKPDPQAKFVDAFMTPWNNYCLTYAFPPFSMIGRTLQKIRTDNSTTLLIAPLWPTRPWFALALQMLAAPPVLLPKNCLLLPQDRLRKHPLASKLVLVAMILSGRDSLHIDYRITLPIFCSRGGEQVLTSNIGRISKDGTHFVHNDRVIQFHHL